MLGSVRLRVCWESLDARQRILAQAEDVAIVGLLDGQFSEVEALKTGEVRRLGLAEPFWRRVTILADHVRPCLAMPRCDGAIERPFFVRQTTFWLADPPLGSFLTLVIHRQGQNDLAALLAAV